jgi:hypothetical protein
MSVEPETDRVSLGWFHLNCSFDRFLIALTGSGLEPKLKPAASRNGLFSAQ